VYGYGAKRPAAGGLAGNQEIEGDAAVAGRGNMLGGAWAGVDAFACGDEANMDEDEDAGMTGGVFGTAHGGSGTDGGELACFGVVISHRHGLPPPDNRPGLSNGRGVRWMLALIPTSASALATLSHLSFMPLPPPLPLDPNVCALEGVPRPAVAAIAVD